MHAVIHDAHGCRCVVLGTSRPNWLEMQSVVRHPGLPNQSLCFSKIPRYHTRTFKTEKR